MTSTFWAITKSSFSSLVDKWDSGRSKIKGLSIQYCKIKRNNRRLEHFFHFRLALYLNTHVDASSSSLTAVYLSTLARIESMDLRAARGAQAGARVKRVEEKMTFWFS